MYPAPFSYFLPHDCSGPVPGRFPRAGNPRFFQTIAVEGGKPLHGLELLLGHKVPQGIVSSGFHRHSPSDNTYLAAREPHENRYQLSEIRTIGAGSDHWVATCGFYGNVF